jgi:hypothetical protein
MEFSKKGTPSLLKRLINSRFRGMCEYLGSADFQNCTLIPRQFSNWASVCGFSRVDWPRFGGPWIAERRQDSGKTACLKGLFWPLHPATHITIDAWISINR